MSIFQSIILGIVQGFSEFLPISSSAHLVLIPAILGWVFPEDQIFPFDILVQLGTLVAVIIYFWPDLVAMATAFIKGIFNKKPFENEKSRLAWFIILATIPAGMIGLLLDDVVEAAFKSPWLAAVFLFITALMMWLGEHFSRQDRELSSSTWIDVLLIGLSQALAIFPGISRSGATISMGMGRHLDRSSAGRFSFLMSIPIMLASSILGVKELLAVEDMITFVPVMAIGFVTAGVIGYLSIRWLMRILKEYSLKVFSYYCLGFAVFSLLMIYVF